MFPCFWPASGIDFDSDGHREYVYQGSDYSSFVHAHGGSIVELDINRDARNILDCASLVEERPPRAFQDKVSISFGKIGKRETRIKDFSSTYFEWCHEDKAKAAIACKAETGFPPDLIRGGGLELRKEYSFQRKTIKVSYIFSNQSDQTLDAILESSLSFGLYDPKISVNGFSADFANDRLSYGSASIVEIKEGRRKSILSIGVSQPLEIDIVRLSKRDLGSITPIEMELIFKMVFSMEPLSIKPLTFDLIIG